MSIDEMLAALRASERNLNKEVPSEDSIKNLDTLAKYYAHQQDQLKGFEKDPKRLEENLKIIDAWIKEIKLLTSSLLGKQHA